MTEAASASEVLAGQAEEAPAAQEETGNAASPWYGEGIDSDTVGYIENKGWKSANDTITGYRNLEQLLGADKANNAVVVPKEDDNDGWNALYNRLGRPDTKEGYKLEGLEEGADDQLANWFKEQAHTAGLNQSRANNLYTGFNEMINGITQEENEKREVQQQKDLSDLKTEWGMSFVSRIEAGKQAASRFGLDSDKIDSIEKALGTRDTLSLMAKIGRAMGEDKFEAGDTTSSGFGVSPAAAKQQISELMLDTTFTDAYTDGGHVGHAAAREKMDRLQALAHPPGS